MINTVEKPAKATVFFGLNNSRSKRSIILFGEDLSPVEAVLRDLLFACTLRSNCSGNELK